MADTGFTAYLHARPKAKNVFGIFYVGKGSPRRAHDVSRARNAYYSRVVAKHGAENILVGVLPCSSEAIAFDLERGLIKCLRRMGVKLTNMTDGGEGTSGHVRPEEQRKRISERQLQELSEGRHHTQRQDVVANIRAGHQRAMLAGTHSSVANNPMKDHETAKKSYRTRAEKYGREYFAPSAETKKKMLESNLSRVADGTHHFITDHPMRRPGAAERQSHMMLGRRKMRSVDGLVKMIVKDVIQEKLSEGWVFVSPSKGE